MNNDDYLKMWKKWAETQVVEQGWKPTTVKNNYSALKKIDLSSIETIRSSLEILRLGNGKIKKDGSIDRDSNATFNHRIFALRTLTRCLEETDPNHPYIDYIKKLKHNKNTNSKPHKPYTLDEVNAIMKTAKAWKRQALWIALNTGLRRSEIQNLDVQHINLDEGIIHVISGKGDKDRDVIVGDVKLLKRWSKLRKLNNIEGDNWLFTNRTGKRPNLDSGGVLKSLSDELGFKVGWHRCRATYASFEYETNKDVKTVQEQLGHKSSSTTDRYIQRTLKTRKSNIKKRGNLYK